MKTSLISLILFSVFSVCSGQDNAVSRTSFFSPGFAQVKEGANFGLVFSGPVINYGMTWSCRNDKRIITYGYEIGAGILFSKNIPALDFYLKPLEIAYMFGIPGSDSRLNIGPAIKFEYNYNFYPQLQSGFDYWFTNFSFGLNALYTFNYRGSSFQLLLNSSLMGITSRQADYRDPYFYDIGFKYAIRDLHQNLTFGSINAYNTTNFEILWKPGPDSRFTFGYTFKYSGYYQAPKINMVSHSIKFLVNKKQK